MDETKAMLRINPENARRASYSADLTSIAWRGDPGEGAWVWIRIRADRPARGRVRILKLN